MDDSIFDCIFANLDTIRASLDLYSAVYTGLVIVGVFCEIVFLGIDHLDDLKDWKFAATHFKIKFPERPSRIKFFLEFASVGLVVWGLWGELHTASRIENLDILIRGVNEYRALLLEQEAGSAASSAEKAQGSADAANISAGDANKKAEAVGKKAEAINQGLSAAQQYLNWIGKSVNGRLLDNKRLVNLLKGQPKISVEIWYESGNDEEPHFFALQLRDALGPKGAGWSVEMRPFGSKHESDPEFGPAPVSELVRRTADLEGMAFGGSNNDVGANPPSPLSTLSGAIGMCTGPIFSAQFFGDPSIPDGHVIIAIGPNRPNVPEFPHPKK